MTDHKILLPGGMIMGISCGWDEYPVTVQDISADGLRFTGALPVNINERVRFRLLGRRLAARLARSGPSGGALRFERDLTQQQLLVLRAACGSLILPEAG